MEFTPHEEFQQIATEGILQMRFAEVDKKVAVKCTGLRRVGFIAKSRLVVPGLKGSRRPRG